MSEAAPVRPMSVGGVLDRSSRVLRRHLGTLFVTALMGLAPVLLLLAAIRGPATRGTVPAATAGDGGLLLLGAATVGAGLVVSWAALTRQVGQAVVGGTVSIADGIAVGLRALLPTVAMGVGLWFVTVGAVALSLVPAGLVALLAELLVSSERAGGAIVLTAVSASVVGAAVLIAPLAVMGLPALVLEDVGPLHALRRANDLGRGGRARVVLLAAVGCLLVILTTAGLPVLLESGLALVRADDVAAPAATRLLLYPGAASVAGGLATAWMVAAMVLTYHDRRVRREGLHPAPAAAAPRT